LLDSISFNNQKYRFVGIGEQSFSRAPENGPWSTVKLSNNLSTWVTPDTNVTPKRFTGGWQQIGDAIGCGYPTAEKDILIICCTCTAAGYTGGGFEASNVTSVLDGKQPWVTKKVSRLPMTPASPTGWLKGPNMPNSFVYDSTADVLYFFSDFGDKQEGVARVRNFSRQGVTGTIKSIWNEGGSSSESQAAFRAIAVMRGNQMVIDMSKIAKGSNVTITISNALGRVFVNRKANSAAMITVPANALPKGIYMLKFAFDRHEQVQKFIAVGAGR